MQSYKSYLKPYARILRTSMTDAEILLWCHLRRRNISGFRFLRQKPIGTFIVDFFSPEAKIAIEVDGNQHADSDKAVVSDVNRDRYLMRRGIRVLRFSNYQVFCETEAVLEEVWRVVEERGGSGGVGTSPRSRP